MCVCLFQRDLKIPIPLNQPLFFCQMLPLAYPIIFSVCVFNGTHFEHSALLSFKFVLMTLFPDSASLSSFVSYPSIWNVSNLRYSNVFIDIDASSLYFFIAKLVQS